MPEDYGAIARRTIGRWAGNRIALIGDYTEDGDLPPVFKAGSIYEKCQDEEEIKEGISPEYRDISGDVCRIIEHELNGKFEGEGWRDFKRNEK